jgi:hypothetical protein
MKETVVTELKVRCSSNFEILKEATKQSDRRATAAAEVKTEYLWNKSYAWYYCTSPFYIPNISIGWLSVRNREGPYSILNEETNKCNRPSSWFSLSPLNECWDSILRYITTEFLYIPSNSSFE